MRRNTWMAGIVQIVLLLTACSTSPELVSVGDIADPKGDCFEPDISRDGRYVTFTGYVKDLKDGDGGYVSAIFLRDMQQQKTILVSRSHDNRTAIGGASSPSLSADGRFVAYSSRSADILKGNNNDVVHIYVADTMTGITKRATQSSSGELANAITYESYLSSDGRYVLFNSEATDIIEQNDKGIFKTYMHDMHTGSTSLIDYTIDGAIGGGSGTSAIITADNCCIVELSGARNLFGSDSNQDEDQIILWSRDNKENAPVSVNTAGEFADNDVFSYTVDGSGHRIVFASRASNLGVELDGVDVQLFLRDMKKMWTTFLNLERFDNQHIYSGFRLAGPRSLSEDGRYLVVLARHEKRRFFLDAVYDVMVFDIEREQLVQVATLTSANGIDLEQNAVAISGNGRYIVYNSDGTSHDLDEARHRDFRIYRVENPFLTR